MIGRVGGGQAGGVQSVAAGWSLTRGAGAEQVKFGMSSDSAGGRSFSVSSGGKTITVSSNPAQPYPGVDMEAVKAGLEALSKGVTPQLAAAISGPVSQDLRAGEVEDAQQGLLQRIASAGKGSVAAPPAPAPRGWQP